MKTFTCACVLLHLYMYNNFNMCNNVNKKDNQGGHLMCSVQVVFIQFSNLVLWTHLTIAQLPYYSCYFLVIFSNEGQFIAYMTPMYP